jgi:hypothetical protein
MQTSERVFDKRTFDKEQLTCPKCGWNGPGAKATVIDFYGIGKMQQVTCPECDEYLGNLSRESSFTEGK